MRSGLFKLAVLWALLVASAQPALAQYYQIANQIPQLISPALSGSLNYKGFVDASYVKGLGDRSADILEFSTTQGFAYSDWFYMGVGAGVDVLFSNTPDNADPWNNGWSSLNPDRRATRTACMIPLFSDFRFNIGGRQSTSFFIDCRLGASFMVSNNSLQVGDGLLTSRECFYLRPQLGVRIPMNNSGSQALNIALVYQLLTNNYWYQSYSNVTLNALGASIAFEW